MQNYAANGTVTGEAHQPRTNEDPNINY